MRRRLLGPGPVADICNSVGGGGRGGPPRSANRRPFAAASGRDGTFHPSGGQVADPGAGDAFARHHGRVAARAVAAYGGFDGAGDRRTASSARYAGSPCCRHLQLSGRRGPRRATACGQPKAVCGCVRPGRDVSPVGAAKWPIQERGTLSHAITVGSRPGLWRLTAVLMARAIAELLRRRATPAAPVADICNSVGGGGRGGPPRAANRRPFAAASGRDGTFHPSGRPSGRSRSGGRFRTPLR